MQQPDNQSRLRAAHTDMTAGRYDDARAAFVQLVTEGEQQALLYLGWMHERGLGVPADAVQARACYRSLCDAGDPAACYYAASLEFRHGNSGQALGLFLSAADAGHPSAAYWAAALYGGEGGHARDPERETHYLEKAAQLGHAFARRDLVKRRLRGPGSVRSKVLAALQYGWTLFSGITKIARDADDPRVR